MQALHEAGDALLQAVDGVVLRVVAAEAVAQAAQGVSHKLQVAALWAEPRGSATLLPTSQPRGLRGYGGGVSNRPLCLREEVEIVGKLFPPQTQAH